VNAPDTLVVSVSNHEPDRSSFDRLRTSVSTASAPSVFSNRIGDVSLVQNVWLAGVAVSFLALLTGLARLAWIVSRARELHDGAWIRIAGEVSREYGLGRRVGALQSAHPHR